MVFENLRFRSSTRKRETGVFKNLHSGERFWKDGFLVIVFIGYVRTVGQTAEKKCAFSNKNRYVWTGPKVNCDLYLGALWWATKIWRHFPSSLRSRQSKFRDGPLVFWRGERGSGGWKIFSCCHCRGDMVLDIPRSCVVWPFLSDGLLIFVCLPLPASTLLLLAYNLFQCLQPLQTIYSKFPPPPGQKNNGPSLKSISLWVIVTSPATT